MKSRLILAAAFVMSGAALHGQTDQMRVAYKGTSDPNHGKCTVDLVVDGAVDVEVRGDSVLLHNLSGQPARGRRYECTGPVPSHPANFRLDPQDGRGKQTLLHDPRDGGAIVVRIEDPQGGSSGYKFDFYWDTIAGPWPGGANGPGQDYGRDRGYQGAPGPGYSPDRGYDRGSSSNYHDQDDYHRDRDHWQGQDWQQRLFERVRQDVEHVRSAYQAEDDQRRLGRLVQELNEMQDKLADGRPDRGELDDVIEWLQRVVRENRLPRRDGQLLSDDLDRLRDFRARTDNRNFR